jgi:hypothetical protein
MDQPSHSFSWLTLLASRCTAFIRSDIQRRVDRVGCISEGRNEVIIADQGAEDFCQRLIRRLSDQGFYGEADMLNGQSVVRVYSDETKREEISTLLVMRVNSL